MACGERGLLKVVHRLTQFIYKNPPNASLVENGAGKKEKKNKGKKGKKDSDSDEEKGGDSIIAQNYQDADRNGDQDSPPPVAELDEEEEEWAEEVQENGELEPQLSSLTISSDQDKSHEEKLEMFFNFVDNKKKGGKIGTLYKELYNEAERLDIVDKAPYVLTEVLLSENILKELATCRNIFLRFCRKNHKCQKNLLTALEMLICQRFPDTLLPKTAHILKGLYDNDIIEEEILIDWQDKSSKKRVGKEMSQQLHNRAAPFIKWLKEAEEETGSEEEEEETAPEVEIEYSYQATSGLKESKVKPAAAQDDDDLNIDDI